MKKGNMTREQAIKAVGLEAVEEVEAINCEPTNRVGYNGSCQNDAETEYCASIAVEIDGYNRTLSAYYYIDNAAEQHIADCDGDGSVINWDVSGYEID